MRTTRPEENNKYYLLQKFGGYAQGIAGSNGGKTVLPNCAGYAACRFNEYNQTGGMKYFAWWRNAEYFYEDGKKQGLKVGSTPKAGAILCWEGIGAAAGHVAFVEEVKADGSIITSESAWGGTAFYTMHRYREGGNWGMNTKAYKFTGFIYSPEPTGKTLLKEGAMGAEVELLQLRLKNHGYDCGGIDGIFGRKTLAQVLLFQYDHCSAVDGIVGAETWGKLS